MLRVFVVSDATGGTAQRIVQSALVQFGDAAVQLLRRPRVLTPEQVRAVVREAAGGDSLIVHTLVSEELRRLMLAESRGHGVDSLDALGPMLDRLAVHLRITSLQQPGLFRQLDEAKTREIEAVAFAFRHDDGQNPEELHRAEIVLVGVSRSMKTPTMLYLAYRGWFAANVPLVAGLPLPAALLSIPADQVFCLTLQAEPLRHGAWPGPARKPSPRNPMPRGRRSPGRTSTPTSLCRQRRWNRIDVTGKAVEEVAREIITMRTKDAPG